MRQVEENEIYGLKFERLDLEFLLEHSPKKKKSLLSSIMHVDTQLREDSKKGLTWRIQGYLPLSKFEEVDENNDIPGTCSFDARIGIKKDYLEIWSLTVPFVD